MRPEGYRPAGWLWHENEAVSFGSLISTPWLRAHQHSDVCLLRFCCRCVRSSHAKHRFSPSLKSPPQPAAQLATSHCQRTGPPVERRAARRAGAAAGHCRHACAHDFPVVEKTARRFKDAANWGLPPPTTANAVVADTMHPPSSAADRRARRCGGGTRAVPHSCGTVS